MDVLIGFDVGWSERKRSCGLSVRGARLDDAKTVPFGDISAVALNVHDVPRVLASATRDALRHKQRVLIVADAIVREDGDPTTERAVDRGCSRGEFCCRARSCPATYGTGLRLFETLRDVLHHAGLKPTPWLGNGPLPPSGVVVTETNPTTSMALALPMADPDSLPSRSTKRRLPDGTLVQAKSDWYWHTGAGKHASELLATPVLRSKENHELVAALWCLALASQLEAAGNVALLGDSCGTYLVGRIDPSWKEVAKRVGIHWKSAGFLS